MGSLFSWHCWRGFVIRALKNYRSQLVFSSLYPNLVLKPVAFKLVNTVAEMVVGCVGD